MQKFNTLVADIIAGSARLSNIYALYEEMEEGIAVMRKVDTKIADKLVAFKGALLNIYVTTPKHKRMKQF